MKKPKDQIVADPHRSIRLNLLTRPHMVGSSSMHASPSLIRGATQYVIMKLMLISAAAIANVHTLCFDIVTSHGATESAEATLAPIPINTSNDGKAQQRSVLKDPNSDR